MSETHTTSAPIFPPGRYGRRRAARRNRPWLISALAVVLLAALGMVAFSQYRQYGDPLYDAKVITYTDITDAQILVEFQVTVPPGGSAVCALRARSRDGAEVAREEVRVTAAAGEEHPVVRHRLATSGRAFLGEVLRCRAGD
ncbi:hypothetical protein GCM10027290_08660 [Micromonospora sonneratiae]|uniref:DUF4307 domain-containing protein n=1 Tax=Micromonospora sonneratiae TaxID=1184706 RepID=A0ABW3YEQ7_9ACTN